MSDEEFDGLTYAIQMYGVPDFIIEQAAEMGFRHTSLPDLSEIDKEMLGEGEPPLPTRLSRISNRDLGDLMDAWSAWADYVGVQKSLLDGCVSRAENIKKTALADARRRYTGAKQDRDDFATLDAHYIEANSDYEKWYAVKKFVAHKLDHAHRTINQISRHITLRSESSDATRRSTNAGNYKPRRPRPAGAGR